MAPSNIYSDVAIRVRFSDSVKRLPASFAVFRQLQFAGFKDDNIKFDDFLKDMEVEICHQAETQQQLALAARALAISHPVAPSTPSPAPLAPTQQQSTGSLKNKRRGKLQPPCSNGAHDPSATSHMEENCWNLHPHKEVEHYQQAMEHAKAKFNPTANLSVKTNFQDLIIVDSGASGHFLKHKAYFISLSTTTSSVFGANGAAIPILGFGPVVIQTAAGPLHLISMAYYSPQLSNSLISLTHYL
jgi:hypothetical protein